MKTLVVFYSRKGSNRYLANKISHSLNCDIEEIKPRLNSHLLFLMKIHLGIKKIKRNVAEYDRIILCGPIWMGRFIPPLRSFAEKYSDQIKSLVFVTCCGSTFEKKDEKFGHGLVFKEVESVLGSKCDFCQAFPINLVLPPDKQDDDQAFMNTHLSDSNFKGEIQVLFDKLMEKLRLKN